MVDISVVSVILRYLNFEIGPSLMSAILKKWACRNGLGPAWSHGCNISVLIFPLKSAAMATSLDRWDKEGPIFTLNIPYSENLVKIGS